MTWFKIDDQSPFHPKIMECGNEAWGAFCRMGAWSSAHHKEGFVTESIALAITTKKVLAKLIASRLLYAENGGYRIHDYLDYNPSLEQIESKRSARAEAGRRGGLHSAQAKQQAKGQAIASPNDKQSPNQNSTPTRPDPTNALQAEHSARETDTPSVGEKLTAGLLEEKKRVLAENPRWEALLEEKTPADCRNVLLYQSRIWREWIENPELVPPEPAPPSEGQVRSEVMKEVLGTHAKRPDESSDEFLKRINPVLCRLFSERMAKINAMKNAAPRRGMVA